MEGEEGCPVGVESLMEGVRSEDWEGSPIVMESYREGEDFHDKRAGRVQGANKSSNTMRSSSRTSISAPVLILILSFTQLQIIM